MLKCKRMTLVIKMLNNIFPLHTKTQNYHLKYPNVPPQMSWYKYLFTFKKSLVLTNTVGY